MQKNIPEIEELVKLISKFPGLGPKSSKRIVLKLINNREELIKPLTNTLAQVYKNIVRCNICGNIKSLNSNCTLQTCSYSDKSYKQICVVENIADMWVIESSGIYKGYYHILGGTLSSSDNKKTDNLFILSLVERVKKNTINEVILATSATIEGQTTAHYIQNSLKDTKVKISKLAQGLPVGGEIEFLDDGTLFSAFKNRGPVTNH
jgi:recombination protein RecR